MSLETLPPPPRPRPRRGPPLAALALIAAVTGGLALAFAATAGWLSPSRISPRTVVNALEANGGVYPGYRRAHAKGLCVSGHFDGNGAAAALSRASVFQPDPVPVSGRFSIGGGDPLAADGRPVFHSLALRLRQGDGQEWRMALDHTPIFPVATPAAFVALQQATTPDPATGKPDPTRLAAFLGRHPETRAFLDWMATAPLPSSFANGSYNSINAFRLIAADGQTRLVRWTFEPEAPFAALDRATLGGLDRDFLFREVIDRLNRGPLRWHLILTLAAPGDSGDDATRPWPADRPRLDAGTLVLDQWRTEESGDCAGVNFDPLILPDGIAASDDPLLATRSAAYSASFTRRAGEHAAPSAAASLMTGGHAPIEGSPR